MSVENERDPRTRLVREKYFSLRPKPLERWLWQQGLPQAAERVFWLHWEEGMRSGDWCSQVPLKRVASQCCVDLSTVTRAYQLLKSLGLIRREDPGRDPGRPFQQATAVTEVRVPRALLVELSGSPNRLNINLLHTHKTAAETLVAAAPRSVRAAETASPVPAALPCPTRAQIQATWGRASLTERGRYFHASRTGLASIEFDAASQLTSEDREQLTLQLQQMAGARKSPPTKQNCVRAVPMRQRLSAFALARVRQRVFETVAARDALETLRQVVWAIEEGALRRFDAPLALNIALKKVREGAWTRPNRMPPNWVRMDAPLETCSAA